MGAGKSNVWAVEPKMQVENPTGGGGMAKMASKKMRGGGMAKKRMMRGGMAKKK